MRQDRNLIAVSAPGLSYNHRDMFRLTRQVRFCINPSDADGDADQLARPPANSYAGYPSMTTLGHYFTLAATLTGPLERSGYLRNIKEVDTQIRSLALPVVGRALASREVSAPLLLMNELFGVLSDAWPGAGLERLALELTPFLSCEAIAKEFPMMRLSQKFEFSASHRLHNPTLSDVENRACYGKCNNPHGHGHNYELQVTLAGTPDPATGLLIDLPVFERTVAEAVIAKFDHKNLNVELPEFATVIPTVENIARVIFEILKPRLQSQRTGLRSVTVWETPKTWCEYSEG